MVVSWTTPGGSSPERRLTVGISAPLRSSARSPKLTGAGSPRTAPTGRLRSAGRWQRRQQAAQRISEALSLFNELAAPLYLELVEATTYPTGVAIHVYRPRSTHVGQPVDPDQPEQVG